MLEWCLVFSLVIQRCSMHDYSKFIMSFMHIFFYLAWSWASSPKDERGMPIEFRFCLSLSLYQQWDCHLLRNNVQLAIHEHFLCPFSTHAHNIRITLEMCLHVFDFKHWINIIYVDFQLIATNCMEALFIVDMFLVGAQDWKQ